MSDDIVVTLGENNDLGVALGNEQDIDVTLGDSDVDISLVDDDALSLDISNGGDLNVLFESYTASGKEFVHIDTTERWNAQRFLIAEKGIIYVYSDYVVLHGINVPAVKIGDGTSYLIDLPFVMGNNDVLNDHVHNNTIHITEDERQFWNNKVTCFLSKIDQTNLVLTKKKE